MGSPWRRWRGYVLRWLDNDAGFGTGVMGTNARRCQNGPINVVGRLPVAAWWAASRQFGLFGGKLSGWVPAVAVIVVDEPALHSGLVGVARGRIPVDGEVTKLSPLSTL
jgi:hypothetical protein